MGKFLGGYIITIENGEKHLMVDPEIVINGHAYYYTELVDSNGDKMGKSCVFEDITENGTLHRKRIENLKIVQQVLDIYQRRRKKRIIRDSIIVSISAIIMCIGIWIGRDIPVGASLMEMPIGFLLFTGLGGGLMVSQGLSLYRDLFGNNSGKRKKVKYEQSEW